jgi:hypothetical protein
MEHWWNVLTRKILRLSAILFHHTFHTDYSGINPGLWDDTLATNCLGHSTAENIVSFGYLHITTLQRASDFKKLPNYCTSAELSDAGRNWLSFRRYVLPPSSG